MEHFEWQIFETPTCFTCKSKLCDASGQLVNVNQRFRHSFALRFPAAHPHLTSWDFTKSGYSIAAMSDHQ